MLKAENARMGADSRGRSKQEKSGVALNEEKKKRTHVTQHKPKQTNQTQNSLQEKQTSWHDKEK